LSIRSAHPGARRSSIANQDVKLVSSAGADAATPSSWIIGWRSVRFACGRVVAHFSISIFMDLELRSSDPETTYLERRRAEATGADRRVFAEQSVGCCQLAEHETEKRQVW
jgi:hypothetical protein